METNKFRSYYESVHGVIKEKKPKYEDLPPSFKNNRNSGMNSFGNHRYQRDNRDNRDNRSYNNRGFDNRVNYQNHRGNRDNRDNRDNNRQNYNSVSKSNQRGLFKSSMHNRNRDRHDDRVYMAKRNFNNNNSNSRFSNSVDRGLQWKHDRFDQNNDDDNENQNSKNNNNEEADEDYNSDDDIMEDDNGENIRNNNSDDSLEEGETLPR